MSKANESDGFRWMERFAYVFLAVLLFAWAWFSDIEFDTGPMGLGIIDPFFMLGVMWIGIVFSMKATIALLQRKSYRAMCDIWKGPLTDIKTNKSIGHALREGKIAINKLAIFPTGGTSKPEIRGFAGTRFLVFPIFYSVVIGGYVIILATMHMYPKSKHGNLLTHIIETMSNQKGFVLDHTKIIVGEQPDPKWAVEDDCEWVVMDAPGKSLNMVEEASINRKHKYKREEAYRAGEQLKAYGYQPGVE